MNRTQQLALESQRYLQLTPPQARRAFGDRVARAFMLDGGAFAEALDFNARLATELREACERRNVPNMWSGR